MNAEPNYTDAQIEDQCTRLKQLEQMGDSFRVVHSEFRSLHDMLRSLLSERQAAMQGQGGEVVDRVAKAIADSAGHGMREKCEHMAHAAISAYQLATWNPVRSVSEEDVEAAILHYDMAFDGGNKYRIAMRAALEHFAAIAQEKQHG